MERRRKIFQFLLNHPDGIKKSEIVKYFDGWYYHNSAFHIGNLLATMVKNGQAIRVRVGVYAPGKSFIPNVRRGASPKASEIVDDNQTSLF